MEEEEEEEEALEQIKGSAVVSALLGWISHTNNPFKVTFFWPFRRIRVAGGAFSITRVLIPPKKGYCSSLGSLQSDWERFLRSGSSVVSLSAVIWLVCGQLLQF